MAKLYFSGSSMALFIKEQKASTTSELSDGFSSPDHKRIKMSVLPVAAGLETEKTILLSLSVAMPFNVILKPGYLLIAIEQ